MFIRMLVRRVLSLRRIHEVERARDRSNELVVLNGR